MAREKTHFYKNFFDKIQNIIIIECYFHNISLLIGIIEFFLGRYHFANLVFDVSVLIKIHCTFSHVNPETVCISLLKMSSMQVSAVKY